MNDKRENQSIAMASEMENQPSEDADFEFAFMVGTQETHPPITADEIISDGQIRPIYPVFNRDLLAADDNQFHRPANLQLLIEGNDGSNSPSSSPSRLDLDGVEKGSYCVWKPGLVQKSASTGSSRLERIKDFVLGRSLSDGKDKFMFLAAEEKSPLVKESAAGEGKTKVKHKKPTELDLISAHRMFYGPSNNGSTSGVSAASRRTYLPYKPDIIGFFTGVKGFRRIDNPN